MKERATPPSYKRHRFPPEIISYSVWLYFPFALRYRDVEELLAERGVILTDETVRQWCQKFGQTYVNELRRHRPRPGDTWHLDAVFSGINGVRHYLWRAVDQDGHVLDILVQPRRDKRAAVRFLRKVLKGLAYVPRVVITRQARERGGGAARRAARRRASAPQGAEQPRRERPPTDPGAGAAHAPVQAPRPRATVPRRVRAHRRPLPPAPPPPRRRHLPRDPHRTLRHLAGRHRRPGHGLSDERSVPHHAFAHQQTTRPDFN